MNKKVKNYLTTGILIVVVVVVFFVGSRESNLIKDDQAIKISGLYSTTINLEDIIEVEIRDSIPKVHRKINALNFLNIKKGTFSIDEFDRARLYLHTNNGPYLYLHTNEETFIINYRNSEKTREEYNELSILVPTQ